MALPTVSIDNRDIILLSGFETVTAAANGTAKKPFVVILDERELERSVKNDNSDAVAYGYVAGRWVAVA
ncbi:MAG: hypothetical protein B7Y80_10710 [Hyphomicrobium sp. 32-62-53]|nr:MAG: hypothetical protein B7Z29_10765 [Hyphomicrobium sp. 12-62-95]OYX99461.1 MAG: hypothetical protein B7Y80_10710 [Hyphomicrobium sp. 32-62-53]